jgi:glycosyltransferase involved in cell wall biosynthesis
MQANEDSSPLLKILALESSMNWGGQEERLLREIQWLNASGHHAILACQKSSAIARRATESGIGLHHVSMRSNADILGFAQLVALVRREKPDLIHSRSSKDSWFALWFHQAGIPVVRSRHMTLTTRMPYARKRIYLNGCRRLIASAGFIAESMRDGIGFPADRIDVIGECVNPGEFYPGDGSAFRQEFGIAPEAPLFAVVGMLRGEKGQMIFARAAREVLRKRPDARFAIVGGSAKSTDMEKDLKSFLAAEFSACPQPPIILTGFRNDVPLVMRAIDCLVVPSIKDAQTLVIPQAFATGKPVIATRVGGIPDLVCDGKNGLLFPVKDHMALAEAMLKLAADPALATKFARAGYELAQQELTTDKKMASLVACYRRAIRND